MGKVFIVIMFFFVFSCQKYKDADAVILNSKYENNDSMLRLNFYNNTKQAYIVLFPRMLYLESNKKNKDSETNMINESINDRYSNKNALYAFLVTPLKYKSTDDIRKVCMTMYHISPEEYNEIENLPTAFEIKSGGNIELKYQLKRAPQSEGTFKVGMIKMRDLLNDQPSYLKILNKMIEMRDNKKIKVYIDDFQIEDSIVVKK
ncbi:hypothetical protein BAX96_14455 [Elizabethkingia anophelis]|nr:MULTISPECIES: hypothetical protein [Elizabethkingia]EJC8058478.1 hypothetical protein [Elizabethkingia anophelis]MCT3755597.1 hypothetical protein [Elizabethkingia anophelis]MCT4033400.1 hypothetical protein [Elizabethkingia anophelis]MCT4046402.1 hypothetical protein [Elizabethkingia anophelis]MCT4251464.1 hypothetical protein [Elizabethkingia anophelis]